MTADGELKLESCMASHFGRLNLELSIRRTFISDYPMMRLRNIALENRFSLCHGQNGRLHIRPSGILILTTAINCP